MYDHRGKFARPHVQGHRLTIYCHTVQRRPSIRLKFRPQNGFEIQSLPMRIRQSREVSADRPQAAIEAF